MATMQQIAVVGAAFDPPTKGHVDVINQCIDQFDEVWLVPSFQHAFAKKMTNYATRIELCQRFICDLNHTKIKLEACEHFIKKDEPVYSYDLMCYLKDMHPNAKLHLVLGPDNAVLLGKFYQHQKLIQEFHPFIAKENVQIRSTKVRERIKQGQSVCDLLTPSVFDFITAQNLYA